MSLLRRLSALLALEGVLLVGLGIAYGVASGSGAGAAVSVAAAGIVVGGLLLLLARAVVQQKRWARGPAVTLNVFPLPLAAEAFRGGAWWVGVALLGFSASVLYLFATPELRTAFQER